MLCKILKSNAVLALVLSVSIAPASAEQYDATEAPELGRSGTFPVGTSYSEIEIGDRVRLTSNGVAPAKRVIGLRLWYPSASSTGDNVRYVHKLTLPDGTKHEIIETGSSSANSPPVNGKFPIVIISHGYGGWSEHMSRLGEHLASRGYIVASLDHRDDPVDSLPSFLLSFGNVIVDRSQDQKAVIRRLLDPKFIESVPALKFADASQIALLGYSMGGFGALAAAGAPYDQSSKVFANHPQTSRELAFPSDASIASRIKALILFAPWGGQPDNRAWSDAGLAQMTKPLLLISGDQDDVVNHENGVRWLFDSLKNADRYHLIYREARHNIVGNPINFGTNASAEMVGYAREPVWRQERLNQINQHFVTAFLDVTLKGQATTRRFLDVPVPVANDGLWPTKLGDLDRGEMAGDDQPGYWRGFQRRWATGLELHHKSTGQ